MSGAKSEVRRNIRLDADARLVQPLHVRAGDPDSTQEAAIPATRGPPKTWTAKLDGRLAIMNWSGEALWRRPQRRG